MSLTQTEVFPRSQLKNDITQSSCQIWLLVILSFFLPILERRFEVWRAGVVHGVIINHPPVSAVSSSRPPEGSVSLVTAGNLNRLC